MKLLTKQIEKKLEKYPLYSQENVELDDHDVICKFFNPYGAGTWLVFEGNKEANGDWTFFGSVNIFGEWELGYFSLRELSSIRCKFCGVTVGGIERDTMYDDGVAKYGEFIND